MSALSQARCVGRHWLFDSVRPDDHEQAREICESCPAIVACRDLLTKPSHIDTIPMPTGTWAGKLYGKRGQVREVA